jgi:hypothetical protein
MAAVILLNALDTLSFLESSLIVTCETDRFVIDITQRGDFMVDDHRTQRTFKQGETERLLEYIGEIKEILTFDHLTDDEVLIF